MSKENPRKNVDDLIKEMQKRSSEKLNSAKERLTSEAKYEAELARQLIKGGKYELSETFLSQQVRVLR